MRLPIQRSKRGAPPLDLADDLRFRVIGILGSAILRLWGKTLRIEWIGREYLDAISAERGRVIWTFWHRHLLTLTYTHIDQGAVVLVSRHKDGEIISQILGRLGYGVVRGSTTRGGARALVEMVRLGLAGHPLAVTPDGPRGPRGKLQSGVLHIAQRSELPIVPLACEGLRTRELDSWDRFQIPHPFTRIAVAVGPLMRIPQGIPADALEYGWGERVTRAIDDCEEKVAAWREARRKTARVMPR
jgi:hypothetical protein